MEVRPQLLAEREPVAVAVAAAVIVASIARIACCDASEAGSYE